MFTHTVQQHSSSTVACSLLTISSDLLSANDTDIQLIYPSICLPTGLCSPAERHGYVIIQTNSQCLPTTGRTEVLTTTICPRASILQCVDCPIENALGLVKFGEIGVK